MASTTNATSGLAGRIHAFWVPGCTSCLRMKEFLQKSGLPFELINLSEEPARGAQLEPFGLAAPAVVVGDRAVPGMDLVAIAELIGVRYQAPELLPAAELIGRYDAVSEILVALVGQLSTTQLRYRPPDRDRDLAALATHTGSIMRSFLHAYDMAIYDQSLGMPEPYPENPGEIITLSRATQRALDNWWSRFGSIDPLDGVVVTPWGAATLHETLERSVWHPMQHVRQLAYFMRRGLGLDPCRTLSADEMAGLPLPAGIHAGGTD